MSYKWHEFYIPDAMLGAIDRYIKQATPPGDFLTAVICNDLKEAVSRADRECMRNLPAFVAYFYNKAPMACWGSRANMDAWAATVRNMQRGAA